MFGSAALAAGPTFASSVQTGTSLQPKQTCPCSIMIFSTSVIHLFLSFSSFGRNTSPAPNCPFSGKSKSKSDLATFLKNPSGKPTNIPAPSPVLGSHPHPPCVPFLRAFLGRLRQSDGQAPPSCWQQIQHHSYLFRKLDRRGLVFLEMS